MMSDRRTISSDVWWLVAGAAGQVGDDGAGGDGNASTILAPPSTHGQMAERAHAGPRAAAVEEPESPRRGCVQTRGVQDEMVSRPAAREPQMHILTKRVCLHMFLTCSSHVPHMFLTCSSMLRSMFLNL